VSYDTACLDCAIVKIDAIYEFIREARPLLDMAKTMMTGSKTERLKVMMRGGGK
jgi:hypothetical protein